MAIEYREIDGVRIPVGIEVDYFGASENENVPEMINPKENGIVKAEDGSVIATFANGAQAVASLFLSRFGMPQLKQLIPQLRNVGNYTIVRMVQDTCARDDRKDFIESLDGNMPRQLTISEMVNAVKVVGEPSSRAVMMPLSKVLDMIKLDMENVDSIVPEKRTRAVKTVSKADVQPKIERTVRSISRINKKIANIRTKISTLQGAEKSNTRNYKITKLQFELENTENLLAKSQEKLDKLNQLFETAV